MTWWKDRTQASWTLNLCWPLKKEPFPLDKYCTKGKFSTKCRVRDLLRVFTGIIKNLKPQHHRFWPSCSPHRDHHIKIIKQGITTAENVRLLGADMFYWRRSWRTDCQVGRPKEEGTPLPVLFHPVSFAHWYTWEEFTHKLILLMMFLCLLYALLRVSVTVMIINFQRIFFV